MTSPATSTQNSSPGSTDPGKGVATTDTGAAITRRRPRPGAPGEIHARSKPGRPDRDLPRVVEKIAARAALEVDDAGGAGFRMLGRGVPGAGRMGIRGAGLDALPTVTADVDGQLAFLDLEPSVRWPAPALKVAEAVRQRVIDRIEELVGLQVREVNIDIAAFVARLAPPRVF